MDRAVPWRNGLRRTIGIDLAAWRVKNLQSYSGGTIRDVRQCELRRHQRRTVLAELLEGSNRNIPLPLGIARGCW
jgi:hypothetical protein